MYNEESKYNGFNVINQLGKGRYSEVFLAEEKNTHIRVALKVI
jgi:serine/threonine protein kinase